MGRILVLKRIENSRKKAQMHLTDLVISLSVFLLVLLFLYIQIEKNVIKEKEKLKELEANYIAENVAFNILNNYGYPTNWATSLIEPSNYSLKAIGTAESYLVVDRYKLFRLTEIYSNNYTKQKLDFGQYDGDINITFLNDTNLIYLGDYNQSKKILAQKKLFGVYENQIIILKVRVWEK